MTPQIRNLRVGKFGRTSEFFVARPGTYKTDRRATNETSKTFWADLPKTEKEWLERRELVGCSTLQQTVRVFCVLTHVHIPAHPQLADGSFLLAVDGLEEVLDRSKQAPKWLEFSDANSRQIDNFGTLLFLCATAVLRKLGVAEDKVNQLTMEYFRSKGKTLSSTPYYLSRLRGDAIRWCRWASSNEEVLGHGVWEFLLLCKVLQELAYTC